MCGAEFCECAEDECAKMVSKVGICKKCERVVWKTELTDGLCKKCAKEAQNV